MEWLVPAPRWVTSNYQGRGGVSIDEGDIEIERFSPHL